MAKSEMAELSETELAAQLKETESEICRLNRLKFDIEIKLIAIRKKNAYDLAMKLQFDGWERVRARDLETLTYDQVNFLFHKHIVEKDIYYKFLHSCGVERELTDSEQAYFVFRKRCEVLRKYMRR